jgi:hypothetical protein
MLIVQLKYLYWIGPLGALQFLLTANVLLIRFWRNPLTDDEPALVDARSAAACDRANHRARRARG